ncbi:MAG: acetylxylan esterase [Rhodopirellula sp.]|nr:acetylxylan esterase [Rhodopirellula sp.]
MRLRTSFGLFMALATLLSSLPQSSLFPFRGATHNEVSAAEPAGVKPTKDGTFLDFVKSQAVTLRGHDQPPTTLAAWKTRRQILRKQLLDAWGGFPQEHAPLTPRVLGTLQRDGYRIEKVTFQTLPDVFMTANAYVPDLPGKRPAVLCVHGHWKGAKQDPHVQARCIGLARLGFFVLAVDAFGAGERGIGKALGEYHGEMVAATLYPIGRPLSGLQVYENQRAVDYLLTRPEVDGERLGITGASGGGNQSMYAGAFDERFKAVVPVCSVGNYQAYLGAACCMCEVVPGALQFTEEWGVLSLTAPQALMIVSATRDAFQFSVGEAQKSLAFVKPVFQLYDRPANIRHAIFESTHDYNQPMREAMYGWMTRHLKEEGDGSPIPEAPMETEDPESLRCFPGESRPNDWMTIPKFAAREARALLAKVKTPTSLAQWESSAERLRQTLDQTVLSGTEPAAASAHSTSETSPQQTIQTITLASEPGIQLTATHTTGKSPQKTGTVIVLSLNGESKLPDNQLARVIHESGRRVVTLSLRATGKHAYPRDSVARAPDHNTAEWSLFLGRPLLGQWVLDLRTAISTLKDNGYASDELTVMGTGPASIVALCAAALDDRIDHTVAVGSLATFVSDTPFESQRLGILPSGILRDVGDVPHIAALIAPRKVTIIGGVNGAGISLNDSDLRKQFAPAGHVFKVSGSADHLAVFPNLDHDDIVRKLN